MFRTLSFVILLLGLTSGSLLAQDLVYTPKNPAFGGNYLNYSWLLQSANAQNGFEDPDANDGILGEQDQLTQFTESLNRQLLSQISRQLFSDQFGEEGLTEGTFQFGDFQIDVSPGLDGLVISIVDFSTGGQTSIVIPYL